MKPIALDATTTIRLDAAQLRQARLYAWLHGVTLAEAVAELAQREQERKREQLRLREMLERMK